MESLDFEMERLLLEDVATVEDISEEEEEEEEDVTSSDTDDVTSSDTDDVPHPSLRALNPLEIDIDYGSGSDLEIHSDIDSILICTTTIEPFYCRYIFKMSTKVTVTLVKNSKLTRYLSNRDSFSLRHRSHFSCGDDKVSSDNSWYEFCLGSLDWRSLYVTFQIDGSSNLLEDVTTKDGHVIATNAFVHNVIVRAAKYLSKDTETARGGISYLSYNVDRTYNITEKDFDAFAANVTEVLTDFDLRNKCGMSIVRFYMCEHGMRLRKESGMVLLKEMANEDHPHVDILQIHCADTLHFPDGDAILIKVAGTREDRHSLNSLFADSIKLGGKLDKYRIGFLTEFGYFSYHGSPPIENNIITYAQAYCLAAKMA